MHPEINLLTIAALAFAGIAALILLGYLALRPKLGHATKIWLALGLGVFPIAAAAAGNVQGFEATKERRFCGSCHVMGLHAADSDDPKSTSLASRHARNEFIGSENCYACHADYGMFGTVVTKLGGMRHVWLYYTEYRTTPIEEAKRTIVLRKPYPNENCMECHSTQVAIWNEVEDHRALLDDVRGGRVSCASAGCHGLAHPFFRPPNADELRTAGGGAP
ncbi:MAG TPA: NapC/NirT family cytochrome c [Minicystis sp.]|nr:NapC/NirT family cytochrome c [Minicystis sp.]